MLVLVIVYFAQATAIYSAQAVAVEPVEEGGTFGIAPYTDRVDFGDIPAGSSLSKEISQENQGSVPNNIRVFTMGSIGSFIEITPESFTLEAGETQTVELEITMPASATPGQKFTGRIIILRFPKRLW